MKNNSIKKEIDPIAEVAGTRAEGGDVKNTILEAEVYGRQDDTGTFTVKLIDSGRLINNCEWAVGHFSALLGVQTKYIPEKGSRVLLINGRSPLIVATLPSRARINTDLKMLQENNRPGVEAYSAFETAALGSETPVDLLEGELDITNALGAGIRILTTIAQLNAGDRAKVETHLLDGLVRVVSEAFQHFSCFGDFQVYNDGRLNSRIDGTSYEHEAWGVLEPNAERAAISADGKINFADIAETGRWRFSEYIGFLGNFVHRIVSDPTETLGEFADTAIRSGKGRQQIMNDGTILMQSVSEICLERVCRIPVPIEKKKHDDPEGTLRTEFGSLNSDYLKLWSGFRDEEQLLTSAFRLREYARWLNTYHSFSRFLQLKEEGKDWDLKTEDQTPEPSWFNKEKDVEDANSGLESYHSYACIRILRDASIVLWDGSGSSITMSRGDIICSAARDLHLKAPGSIHVRAGNHLHMVARRNIHLLSAFGGITAKARTWIDALCEAGSIWLKSDAKVGEEPPGKENANDPDPHTLEHGVFIESTGGPTGLVGEGVDVASTGYGEENILRIKSQTHLVVSAGQDLALLGRRVVTKALISIFNKAPRWAADIPGKFVIKDKLTLVGSSLFTGNVVAQILQGTRAVLSKKAGRGYPVAGLIGAVSASAETSREDILDGEDGGIEEEIENWPDEAAPTTDDLDARTPVFDPADENAKWKLDEAKLPKKKAGELFQDVTEQFIEVDFDGPKESWDTKIRILSPNGRRPNEGSIFSETMDITTVFGGGEDLRTPSVNIQDSEATEPEQRKTQWKWRDENE